MRHLGWFALFWAVPLAMPLAAQAQSVGGLMAQALRAHPSIQAQQAQVDAASAEVDSATWQRFPTVSFGVDQGATTTIGNSGVLSTLRLQQPLWTGGRLTALSDKAQAQQDLNAAQLQEVRQQLALQVVQAYGDWVAGTLKTQAQEKTRLVHQRLLEQVQRRLAQGLSAESDWTLVQTRLNLIAADSAQAQAQAKMALTRLSQLLGRRLDPAVLQAHVVLPRPVNAPVEALLDAALADNPGIQKALAQVRVQQAGMKEREADLKPEVYVRAERQYGVHTLGLASPVNRLYVGVSSKLGAGLSSLSDFRGASLRHQAALADVDAQRLVVSAQVLADHALAVSSQARQTALEASLYAAGQVAESYDRQFLAARKTWLDVMNAAREVAQTELALADVQASWLVVSWRLALYTEPLSNLIENTP